MRRAVAAAAVILGWSAGAAAQQDSRDCAECPVMVRIPPGTFLMGAAEHDREGADPKVVALELPQHRVTLRYGFLLGKYEVTRAQFSAFVAATGHAAGDSCYAYGSDGKWSDQAGRSWRKPGYPQTEDDPVVCVNWHDAKTYAAWLQRRTGRPYRLPSEAEWEYAARAGAQTVRFWGDGREAACRYANVADLTAANALNWKKEARLIFSCADTYTYTAPVGRFEANAFGLHDMLGNVWEWAEDCGNNSYQGAPTDGSAWVAGECSNRVVRGGSWLNSPRLQRSATRGGDRAGNRTDFIGFRVARTE
jgi:formylglycine-generating enzyme